MLRYILSGKHYQDSLKGMICAKTNITQMIHDDETKIELSNKPKLILIILTSCVYGFVIYYFIFALKQRLRVQNIKSILTVNIFRKLYSIRTLQINLMDLKQHFVFCNLFIYRLFLDQGLNLFIQTYYKELGPENAFTIWWTFFYIEHVGKRKK